MSDQQPHCTYTLLEGGIHRFVYHQPTRRCVDEYIEMATQLAEAAPEDELLLLLLVMPTRTLPPLVYMQEQAKSFYTSA